MPLIILKRVSHLIPDSAEEIAWGPVYQCKIIKNREDKWCEDTLKRTSQYDKNLIT
jgi:hypothetical protein